MRVIIDGNGVKVFGQEDVVQLLRGRNVRSLIDSDGDEILGFAGLVEGAT